MHHINVCHQYIFNTGRIFIDLLYTFFSYFGHVMFSASFKEQTVLETNKPLCKLYESHPEGFHPAIPKGNNAWLDHCRLSQKQKHQKDRSAPQYKANSVLGRTDLSVRGPAKLKWSRFLPQYGQRHVSRTRINNGREGLQML